jgi:hypothetical protein
MCLAAPRYDSKPRILKQADLSTSADAARAQQSVDGAAKTDGGRRMNAVEMAQEGNNAGIEICGQPADGTKASDIWPVTLKLQPTNAPIHKSALKGKKGKTCLSTNII